MNNGTGKTLFTKAADTRSSTGSTTKIMTAHGSCWRRRTSTWTPRSRPEGVQRLHRRQNWASSARLIVGDKVTVRQLLYGLMLPSGCDAAYALADKFGTRLDPGGAREVVHRQDEHHREVPRPEQHALRLVRRHRERRELLDAARPDEARQQRDEVLHVPHGREDEGVHRRRPSRRPAAPAPWSWENTNALLGSYSGTIGVKTGSGPEAKYCLVFAATRNGKTVIGTVLASSSGANRTADAKKLMDYGFKK